MNSKKWDPGKSLWWPEKFQVVRSLQSVDNYIVVVESMDPRLESMELCVMTKEKEKQENTNPKTAIEMVQ